ncbi:armadillo/beta-catenin repeat family protein [Artemisia annua]|uniref:Armadillo/beta-catenin repeat family protein n=1 Tax=Artemisia annua TaxID=35608 RepID=A0A2U1MGH2_ARTAN|nr:armadillo/beta-catenin repeat family protein [Artemisia annua]
MDFICCKVDWDSDTYEFDELLTEFASQKRVYEVVAKHVVEVDVMIFPAPLFAIVQPRSYYQFSDIGK